MDEGDEVLDGYAAGVEGRRDDESELSGIKNAVRATMSFRDRFVFYIRECPAKECCSDGAWNKTNKPWSFDSPDGTCALCKKHLMNSSPHSLPEEEADELMANVEVEHYTDFRAASKSMGMDGKGKPPSSATRKGGS